MTYAPKIERVFSGEITQTIRRWWPGQPKKMIGDDLLIHTWEGKPYRSKWGKRLYGIVTYAEIVDLLNLSVEELDELAILDGIVPPNGEELKRTLARLNHGCLSGDYQIIRWLPYMTEERTVINLEG
jgi:hypothetical protein